MKNIPMFFIFIIVFFLTGCELIKQYQNIESPIISLDSGSYNNNQQVVISCETEGAEIYYDIDGNTPTKESMKYNGPIIIDRSTTLYSIAISKDILSSAVKKDYILEVSPPSFTIEEGTYDIGQIVSISSITEGASIYYTTDGSIPTEDDIEYNAPVIVDQTTTVNSIAVKNGYENSNISSSTYIINPISSPIINLPSGEYNNDQTATITCNTEGVNIYYTLNGDQPSEGAFLYINPIDIDSTINLKAIAVLPNTAISATSEQYYEMRTSTPIISPEQGSYELGQTITLTSNTIDSTIYYTTDGSMPTINSLEYTDPFIVDQTTIIKCIAVKDGYLDSDPSSNLFTITPVKTPTIDLVSGTYYNDQLVTLHCATEGTSIYYTLNGSLPTEDSILYTNPIQLTSSMTLKVIATLKNTPNSAINERSYNMLVSDPNPTPADGIYEEVQMISLSSGTVDATIYYTTDGSNPSIESFEYTEPFFIDQTTTIMCIAVKNGYENSSITSHTYTIEPVEAPVINLPSGTYYNDQVATISCDTEGATIYYSLDGDEPSVDSFEYYEGIPILSDKVIKAIAVKENKPNSHIVTHIYSLKVSPPIISLSSGTYDEEQSITLSNATDNSDIYYTLDGTTPDSNSKLYTGPITINSSTELRVIATKLNYINSVINEEFYTINGNGSFQIMFATPENENIDLTSSADSFISKSEISSVQFNVSGSYTEYYWYINNELQLNQETNEFTWDISSIESGSYNIICFVQYNGLSYSKEVKVRIVN